MADIEPARISKIFRDVEKQGNDSIISEYCQTAIGRGHSTCVWLCYDRRGRTLATDICVETEIHRENQQPFRLSSLAYRYGWWKRFSIYSAKKVEAVEIAFCTGNKKDGFDVIISPIDVVNSVNNINKRIEELRNEVKYDTNCGIEIDGRIHSPHDICPYELWHMFDETYCPVESICDLEAWKAKLESIQQTLDFHWSAIAHTECLKFLKDCGVVHSYDKLSKITFDDNRRPLGQRVRALRIVEGWQCRYLISLIGTSVILSIIVVAVVTLVNRNIEIGLAAGSYSLACAALLLGLLTMFSAIL